MRLRSGSRLLVLARRVLRRADRDFRKLVDRRRDRRTGSYAAAAILPAGELAVSFIPPDLDGLPDTLVDLAGHYMRHRFDLLGSGWTLNRHGVRCRGLEGYRYSDGAEVLHDKAGHWLAGRINPANLSEAQAVWRLVDHGYEPIDWQLDIKSGFRWNEAHWYRDIRIAPRPGADIKVPWELARMHHLPQLALVGAMQERCSPETSPLDLYAREFRNQILDFIATNPPRFGANWACAMDVAIRLVNWLVARDLFQAAGKAFDSAFDAIFKRSVYEHGRHIAANLEWVEGHSGNHYLADIVGLLFAAAYLPASAETDAWLALAVQELAQEAGRQFNDDGSNFEASTAYHRLSLELMLYGVALLLGLPAERKAALNSYDHKMLKSRRTLRPAPSAFFDAFSQDVDLRTLNLAKFQRSAQFVIDITRPDGHIVQIGDNDSGRLLKLLPSIRRMTVAEAKESFANLEYYSELSNQSEYLYEDHLDHRHVVAAANAFFDCREFGSFSQGWHWETRLLKTLVGQRLAHPPASRACFFMPDREASGGGGEANSREYRFDIHADGTSTADAFDLAAYPDFGIYFYRSKRVYLAIRCGPIGLNGLGAHAHNDPLSIELWIDDQPIVVDPGTYLYTPAPLVRDRFRSVKAHFAPRLADIEPGRLDRGVFRLGDEAQTRCVRFDKNAFEGFYRVGTNRVHRRIMFEGGVILVRDWTDAPIPLAELKAYSALYSPGYGWFTSMAAVSGSQ